MKKRLYTFIFYKILGWKIKGTVDENIKKCILMLMPHTSWYDFFIGLFVRGIIGLEMNFVAKKELFVFPLGYYFKSVGGAALDRTGNKNSVDATVDIFNSREVFRLGIAPEGTRKKVTQLKTGFYYISHKANVPIIPVAFDYTNKEAFFGMPFWPTGNYESDMKIILSHFKGCTGKYPQNDYAF